MIHGASVVGARCKQRAQITQSHGVTRRRSTSVAGVALAFRFIPPCSPIRATVVSAGDGWVHEVKFDGYRVQAHKVGSWVVIYSRNGHDFTERFTSVFQIVLNPA